MSDLKEINVVDQNTIQDHGEKNQNTQCKTANEAIANLIDKYSPEAIESLIDKLSKAVKGREHTANKVAISIIFSLIGIAAGLIFFLGQINDGMTLLSYTGVAVAAWFGGIYGRKD